MSKNKIIIIIFILLVTITIIIGFNSTKKSYAVGTTLVENVKALNKGSSWSAGASGVYYTNSHEYRYVGANVNNYVKFNNDMYRIIGVFDSNSHGKSGEMVKLIRSRPLGGYSWGVYNATNTSDTYCKSDWTGNTTGVKANLNVLLNEYFYNKTNTSSTYGPCVDWTYYSVCENCRTNNCSLIVGYGIEESLRGYIETATWYLYGSYSSSSDSKQNWYLCERGGNSCTSGDNGKYSTSTEEKIGLMYLSDYLYASSYFSSTDTTKNYDTDFRSNNWLYKGTEWTLTLRSDSSCWIVPDDSFHDRGTYMDESVRPTFYLKSSVYVTGGDGSFDNPFTLGCDNCN